MKIFITILATLTASTLAQEILEVTCGQDAIEARFNKQTAIAARYGMNELHFNDPTCLFDEEVGEFYVRRIEPLGSCGTDITTNNTHAIYRNSISSGEIETGLSFPHGIIVGQPENNRLISVSYKCTYKIDLRVSTPFLPNITIIKIPIPDAIGEGSFEVSMAIYADATYSQLKEQPGTVPVLQPDDTVFVGITIVGDASPDIYLLMRRCWATPNEEPDSEPYYDLITKNCPVKGAVQDSLAVTQNGIGHQALWQSKVFRFIGDGDTFQNVWLHCDLTICVRESCEPTCDARRKRRSIMEPDSPQIVSVAISRGGSVKVHIDPEGDAVITIKNETEFDLRHEKQVGDNSPQWYNNSALLIGIGAFAALCMICLTIALIAVLMRMRRATARPQGEVTPTGTINKGFSI